MSGARIDKRSGPDEGSGPEAKEMRLSLELHDSISAQPKAVNADADKYRANIPGEMQQLDR